MAIVHNHTREQPCGWRCRWARVGVVSAVRCGWWDVRYYEWGTRIERPKRLTVRGYFARSTSPEVRALHEQHYQPWTYGWSRDWVKLGPLSVSWMLRWPLVATFDVSWFGLSGFGVWYL